MKQKFVLISMDAMIYEDLDYLQTLPSFKRLLQHSSMVKRLQCIYPTLTYPCHATMVTGNFPKKHGIIHNMQMCPGIVKSPWLWFHESYQCRDLFDACKEAGLTTASVAWPTTGLHPNIDYLMDEIAGTKARCTEDFHADFLRTGTTEELWQSCLLPHIHLRTSGSRHPALALFSTHVFCDILRIYKPDVALLHIANIDHYRHKTGVFSDLVRQGLEESDRMLGMVFEALEASGELENTNIVVTSDHGQIDVQRFAHPNVLLAQNGYLTLDQDGNVSDWKAWCQPTGTCVEVFVKDSADETALYRLLQKKAQEGCWGFSCVYTRQEAAAQGFDGPFSFILETDDRSAFEAAWTGSYFQELPAVNGSHGFHPDKGPRPTLIVSGPGFQRGVVLEAAHLTDGAPTWAKLLQVALPDTDGKPLEMLLASKEASL